MDLRNRTSVKLALFAVLAIAFVLFAFAVEAPLFLTPVGISAWLAWTGAFAPLTYMAVMALVVATPLPSLPLNFAAGAFFGPLPGTLYSVIGATGGALISFTIARFLGREFIERFLKGHIHFCTPCSDKLMAKVVFFARLVPVFSFDLISYGAGLTKMSVRNFIIANFLGMLPLTFAYNYAGTVFAVGNVLSIVLGAVMVSLFFLLPGWIERRNLFSLQRFFEHPPEEAAPPDMKNTP
jgi:uncharacterized membrane protein YdjX (TVP38/TMEM64 family)